MLKPSEQEKNTETLRVEGGKLKELVLKRVPRNPRNDFQKRTQRNCRSGRVGYTLIKVKEACDDKAEELRRSVRGIIAGEYYKVVGARIEEKQRKLMKKLRKRVQGSRRRGENRPHRSLWSNGLGVLERVELREIDLKKIYLFFSGSKFLNVSCEV